MLKEEVGPECPGEGAIHIIDSRVFSLGSEDTPKKIENVLKNVF